MFDYECKASKLGLQKQKANYIVPRIETEIDEYAFIDNYQQGGEVSTITNTVNVTLKEMKS